MSPRRRWIAGILGLVVIVTISASALWSARSGLVRWLVIRQLNAVTNRQATIERVDLHLRQGRLEIVGLRLADREPGPPLAELDRLGMRFDPRSLFHGDLAIGEVALQGVRVRIVRSERGELNIPDLWAHGQGARGFTVDRLTLADGHVSVEDHTRTPVQNWRADDIAVEVTDLSTRPEHAPGFARLAATVAGAPVSAEISELRLAPLHFRGHVVLKDVDATLAGIYLPADVVAVVEGARLTASVAVTVDPRQGISLDAQGRLDALALRNRRTGDPFVSAPSLGFTVEGARTDASGRAPTLGRIEVTGAATLFDARGSAAGRLAIERLRLSIEEAATAISSPGRVTVTATFSGGGGLEVHGPFRLAPLAVELRARVTDLDATVLLSYVDLPVRLSGVLDSDLTVDLASSSGSIISRFRGRAALKRAAVTDGAREIARVRQIEVDGVDAEWPRVAVAHVRVVQPVVLVERDQDGHVRLATLFAPPRPGLSGGAAARLSPGAAVEIGEIAVDDGTLTLDDAAATPPARLMLTRLRASARNAGWPAYRPVSIDVQAAAPGGGTLGATGTVSLDPVRVDVRARLAGAALAPYQGYLPFPMRVQGFAHLDLAIAGSFGPTVTVTARGTGALNNLIMGDGDRRILRVTRVETTGLEYTWPATLTVDRLHVGRSRVRVERRADGTFPLRALFARAQTPTVKREPAVPAPGGATFPAISVTVRDAVLEDGGARFVDGGVSPTSGVEVSEVRLEAHGFTWPARGPMPIEFRAATPGGGRVSVNGALDLAAASLDAKVILGGVDLALARPYLPVRAHVAARAGADLDVNARLDPLSITVRGRASLGDVAFGHGDRPVITVARVEATGLDYTWPSKVAIDRLRVQAPRAVIERTREGKFPLVAIFTGPRETQGSRVAPQSTVDVAAPPLEVSIRESVLQDGSATMTDGTVSPGTRFDVARVRLVARDFAWPPRGSMSLRLRASLPGEGTVRAQGQLGLAPTTLDLDVNVDGVDLAPARPYLRLRGQIGGKAGATLKVNATTEPLAITARGSAALADVSISEGKQPLLTVDRVELTALDYVWPATVSIDRLRVQRPWALIDRISGRLPVLDALTSPPPRDARRGESHGRDARRHERAPRSEPGASGPPAALQLKLRRGVVENGAATIVDGSMDPPARLEITGAGLALRDLAWPPRGPSGFVLRAATPNGGRLEARGQLRLDAPAIDTKLVLERADLASLQPLIPGRGRIAGRANADLQVKGALTPLALSITGQLAVADASFGDAERALVTAKGVDLGGVAAEWPRRRATIQRIRIREPWALVERDAGGALPLRALIAPGPAGGAVAPTPGGAAPPGSPLPATADGDEGVPRIEVGTLVVEEGFLRFADRTTTPRFVEEASRLAVTARGLGTAPATRSEIAVSARLTGGAQLDLRGTMGPIGGPLFADIQGKLSGLTLSRTNSYLNPLLGWVARQGSIGGTTRFRIRDDHLEAENEIVIEQSQFVPSRRGDEVRERVGVPLDLLVSLLENSHREVRLSVPVTGTLSSRHFDFGDAVWEAIRTAAINVLALPVSWVGKMFYTADSRIAAIAIWPVSFEPGTTRMRRGIDTHAARLATFMRQTPSIAFAMKSVMTVEDVDALKQEALRQRIDTLARDAGSPDSAAARLFAERFPGRPVPTEPATMVAELARVEPLPDGALRALANARVALIRHELESKGGVDPTRLLVSEGTVPVETSGPGRVEFEMMPDAAPTQ